MGIEPTYSAWKADILAVESHPQYLTILYYKSLFYIVMVYLICFLVRKAGIEPARRSTRF